MKFFVAAATAASLLSSIYALRVETPGGVQVCRPTKITWTDEANLGPYFLSLITPGDQNNPVIKDFGPVSGNSFTWNVDLPPNTGFVVKLIDKDGNIAVSGAATIGGDPANASCVNNSVSGSGIPGGPAPTTGGTVGNTSGSPTPTNPAPTNPPANNSSSKPASTGSAPASTGSPRPSNAASPLKVGSLSLLGLLGIAGAAAL